MLVPLAATVHNLHYDFNVAALPIGASLFARLVEKKLPRLSTTKTPCVFLGWLKRFTNGKPPS
jgi:hypothetical protein